MARKSLSFFSLRRQRHSFLFLVALLCAQPLAQAADTNALDRAPIFLGAESCASSGCHGGAGHTQNQFIVWSLRDVHHARPFATLTTARSRQIAAALKIKNPSADGQCISCHAPLQEIPPDLRGPLLKVDEGVSCESCHGPAENWLRAHTRPDYSHANRVAAGMRDLKDLVTRANTCVACHQTVALPIMAAGHPELIFELEGQSVALPKHWRDAPDSFPAQAWLTGQAIALREICWQIEQLSATDKMLLERRDALFWLLQKTQGADPVLPSLQTSLPAGRLAADKFAVLVADCEWSDRITSTILNNLANSSADFRDMKTPVFQQARRAERLVLALDRVLGPQYPSAQKLLDKLFALAQSIPDFTPADFANALDAFAQAVKNKPAS